MQLTSWSSISPWVSRKITLTVKLLATSNRVDWCTNLCTARHIRPPVLSTTHPHCISWIALQVSALGETSETVESHRPALWEPSRSTNLHHLGRRGADVR